MSLLDAAQLGEVLESFTHELFRLEALPEYAVASDGDDYLRWRDGEPAPTPERKEAWLDILAADQDLGRERRRVRLLTEDLTDYELYSCQWGYTLNSRAGENIRVLRRGEHQVPTGLAELGEFWTVDDALAVAMHYEQGAFVGAEDLGLDVLCDYLRARDTAWDAAEPFDRWWARHSELHDRRVAA